MKRKARLTPLRFENATDSSRAPIAAPASPWRDARSGSSSGKDEIPPREDPSRSTPSADPVDPEPSWSPRDAEKMYGIDRWGLNYFAVNDQGHVVVRPDPSQEGEIDLFEVVHGMRERDLTTPLLLRFGGILDDRIRQLNEAFTNAIQENEYRGTYIGVYPIKVNQQRQVVERVIQGGTAFNSGLEAGSKPELLAVLALTSGAPDRLIVCNGFKDEDYIKATILATKLGRPIIPIVENFQELRLILRAAEQFNVRPRIGVRVKLASNGAGRWKQSLGAKSKFGLFVGEVLHLLETLKEHGMEDCLELVHCHPGSQLQDIRKVKEAIHELGQIYTELIRLGAGLKYIDIGGGLGIDYSGHQDDVESSMNYTLEEYASDVVYRIASICDQKSVAHPTIVSESGRAMVAHHSVLVFDVLGQAPPGGLESPEHETPRDCPQIAPLQHLKDAYDAVAPNTLVECYHDAVLARDQAVGLFNLGELPLTLRGEAERLFWAICRKIQETAKPLENLPDQLRELELILCETYYCNFSVFQSLPDCWAIHQLFPVLPIHRLDRRPSCKGILADLTCDSDGKLDRFPGTKGLLSTLDLHPLVQGEPYFLAAFLVGAYQETLGDLHNLFGDTHVVHIELEDGHWRIEDIVRGDTAREVLHYVQYDAERLQLKLNQDCEKAVRSGTMTLSDRRSLIRFYEAELSGYTYLEPESS